MQLKWWLGRIALFFVATLASVNANARSQYLDFWQQQNPNSRSSEAGCQLCHNSASGGNGWNYYGWSIRLNLDGQTSVGSSFFSQRAGFTDGDSLVDPDAPDPISSQAGRDFIDDIDAGAQPGWREGVGNIIRFRDGSQSAASEVPDDLCGLIDEGSERRPCEIFDPRPSGIPQGDIRIQLQPVFAGLTAPLLAAMQPGNSQDLFVVLQGGQILRMRPGSTQRVLFLDVSNQLVGNYGDVIPGTAYDERGLLGFAFHPNFQNNGRFYTYISKQTPSRAADFMLEPSGTPVDHFSVVSEWTITDASSEPVTAVEEEILIIEQPQFNHNGGTLAFGPNGYLHISLGDGGNANDDGPGHGMLGNAQDVDTPLGSILRIDVDGNNASNGRYGIPASNPFIGASGLDEAIATGFRNPFRFSIDRLTGNRYNIYVGDVGQDNIEEIDVIASDSLGGNYGWRFKEGSFFFIFNAGTPFISDVPPVGAVIPPLIDPIAEYDRDEGFSVIGGHVYRGASLAALSGKYVFADYSRRIENPNGRLFYLDDNQQILEFEYLEQPQYYFTGFSVLVDNELYILGNQSTDVTSNTGVLMKIAPADEDDDALCLPIRSANGNIAVICL